MQRYVDDKDSEGVLSVGADMRKINYCFRLLRELYVAACAQSTAATKPPVAASNPNVTILDASHYDSKELKELKETLRQRDNEISEFYCS